MWISRVDTQLAIIDRAANAGQPSLVPQLAWLMRNQHCKRQHQATRRNPSGQNLPGAAHVKVRNTCQHNTQKEKEDAVHCTHSRARTENAPKRPTKQCTASALGGSGAAPHTVHAALTDAVIRLTYRCCMMLPQQVESTCNNTPMRLPVLSLYHRHTTKVPWVAGHSAASQMLWVAGAIITLLLVRLLASSTFVLVCCLNRKIPLC